MGSMDWQMAMGKAVAVENRKKIYYLWLALFAAGLLLGTLFINLCMYGIAGESGAQLAEIVDKSSQAEADIYLFIHILLKRSIIFIFLVGTTLLCRTSLILYFSTLYIGFCFGSVISSVTISLGMPGVIRLFACLMPHYVFYAFAWILLLLSSHEMKKGDYKQPERKERLALIGIACCVVAGCVSECYVSPVWQRFFEKILS